MKRLGWLGAIWALIVATPAFAHPVPFSYLDFHLNPHTIDVTLVAHVIDVAHDLNLPQSDQLLDEKAVAQRASAIVALLQPRIHVEADGLELAPSWSSPEVLVDRQSLRLRGSFQVIRPPGKLSVAVRMFPYDSNHQTFLNVYEHDTLRSQAILDGKRVAFDYFSGTRQGVAAVVQKFLPSGIEHILIGPDHLLFLIGLLLLGGTLRQLAIVITSFTLAHSITLSLAALNLVSPPARIIEPAIALSIVYVGADNLLVRGGRDMRAWIALAFGLIHGFGFANVLREMDLPTRALGWSLFSFNVGVEIGQLLVVVVVAFAFAWLRSRHELAGRRLAVAGSLMVMAAGAFWFIQRVFFPGGMS